jgi:DNA gyrase subunit A
MDAVQHMITCGTLETLLFLTNKGRIYTLKAHEVPDASRTAKGLPLVNLINLQPNERVTGLIAVPNFDVAEYLIMATKQGKIKRTALSAYSNVRSTGIIALSLEDGDELAGSRLSHGHGEILLVTRKGQGIRFREEDVRAMGRDATGVNAIRLDPGDEVVGFDLAAPGCDLLIVCEKGIGKRTPVEEYPLQGRAGGGVKAITLGSKGGGTIVVARMVHPEDDLVVISDKGLVIRMFVEDIPQLRRPAQGVAVMSMRDGDSVASLARIPRDTDKAGQLQADLDELMHTATKPHKADRPGTNGADGR